MQSQHCFKEPEIINEDWSSISKMEQLKPFQALLQTAAELSKYTIGAKSGVSVACGERLHALLTAFANAILDFEAECLGLWVYHWTRTLKQLFDMTFEGKIVAVIFVYM